jgi:hypothetical protein
MRREASSGRRPSGRNRRTVLVYCGAPRTEPDYLKGLRRHLRSSAVTLKVRGKGVAPIQLVGAAAAYRDQRPGAFDEVWCVTDVDEFDVPPAMVEARRQRVHLAVSNPCFKLWLLLHHADRRAHCSGCTNVTARLKRHVPTYDKARLDFADFAGGIDSAVKRAKDLDPTGQDHERNPSTGLWRLVELIQEKT